MEKRYILTESQFKWVVNGLNEEHHYPSFLSPLFLETYIFVEKQIKLMLRNGVDSVTDVEFYPKDSQYSDKILIDLELYDCDEINDERSYYGWYYCEKFDGSKLVNPKVFLKIPISDKRYTNWPYIRGEVSHELEHLYDDWMDFKNGGGGILSKKKTYDTMSAFRGLLSYHIKIGDVIGRMAYVCQETERKAFSTQAFAELERLHCNEYNFRKVMRQTLPYKNYVKVRDVFINEIKNCPKEELWIVNQEIYNNYRSARIPKFDYHKVGWDVVEKYRKKLMDWGKRIFNEFMKRYCGVVFYYVEGLKKKNNGGIYHPNVI